VAAILTERLMILFNPRDFVLTDLPPGTRSLLLARSVSFTKEAHVRFEEKLDGQKILHAVWNLILEPMSEMRRRKSFLLV
jgi:hypothetical protein